MIIKGLKVFSDKGWKAQSTFTADDGRVMDVPANHKIVCTDEKGDVVNVTVQTDAPLSVSVGSVLPDVELTGTVSKSQFGWSVKCAVASKAK